MIKRRTAMIERLTDGFYPGFAYLTPVFGGLRADRVPGHRRTVILRT